MSELRKEPVLAYIGIGSNLDDPRRQVELAITMLNDLPGCHVLRQSSMYVSAPFGGVEQAEFVNAVVEVETAVPPTILLSCVKELERSRGRDPAAQRWGPRILDLDILLYGDQVVELPDLQIPHPGIAERNFVLLPLREIAPDLVIPGVGPVAGFAVDEQSPLISILD
jgi:2-amino-4-hydroxy-6-hydroxymethyldihydropteridine diphosphokinase